MRAVGIAVLVSLASSPAFAQRPEVVETEIVELRNVAVANMNDHEVIVGSVYNGTFNVPIRWSAKRGIDLFLGEVDGHAMAINDRGVIVGWLNTPGDVPEGFVWSRREGLQRLGLFVPSAINNKGVVVGACAPDGNFGAALPCVWENGTFTHLGVQGGAFDVNDRGEVTGQVFLPPSDWSAFIWSRDEGLTILPKGDAPEAISAGLGINARREVAGFMFDDPTLTPARWTSDGTLVLTPIGDGPFVAINDKSLAVGRYLIPLAPNQFGWFAFGLTATGRVIPLGEAVPLALTNRNVVLAIAEGGGEARVFLWRIRHAK